MDFKPLDLLIHTPLRLAVISILINTDEADFNYLKEKTGASSGNLSVQLEKLKDAGYIETTKGYKGKMPQTLCKISPAGLNAFENYLDALRTYLPSKQG
jgi:DNA-binding MarR family transcriptional regulator